MRKQMIRLGSAALLVLACAHSAEAKNVCLIDTDNVPTFGHVVLSDPKAPKSGEAVSIVGMLIHPTFPLAKPFSGSAIRTSTGITITVIGWVPSTGVFVLTWHASDETFQGAGGYVPAPDVLTGTIDQEVLLASVDCASVPIP